MAFQNANNVDARFATFNNVGGNQTTLHISDLDALRNTAMLGRRPQRDEVQFTNDTIDSNSRSSSSESDHKELLDMVLRSWRNSSSSVWSAPDITDLTSQITILRQDVDFGGFASIHLGRWTNDKGQWDVAVKLLAVVKQGDGGIRLNKRLGREIRAWHRLDHPNIVKLLGVAYPMKGRPAMVMYWLKNGNAMKYLEATQGSINKKMQLVNEVADGLVYLHTSNPPVVHGDLKGTNILITDDGHAALSDFGLSQVIEETVQPTGLTTTMIAGSMRWQAPEVLCGDLESGEPGKLTTASDVWAFACTAYEILTGLMPYPRRNTGQVVSDIMKGVKPSWQENDSAFRNPSGALKSLMDRCWSFDASKRPSMLDVASQLKNLRG